MKRAAMWLVAWAGATVATVAWLSSRVELAADERVELIAGTAAVAAFVTAAVALAVRRA